MRVHVCACVCVCVCVSRDEYMELFSYGLVRFVLKEDSPAEIKQGNTSRSNVLNHAMLSFAGGCVCECACVCV